jgi:16S rRNA (guanine1207-N2)-methyltransferase
MPDEHYFTPRPSAGGRREAVTTALRGHSLTLFTEAGVFSRRQVDRGTRLLIEHLQVGPSDIVLDLGCGYGAIGVIAALLAHKGRVTLIDINQRAVNLARENLRANGIENAEVHQSDGFASIPDSAFDVIALNPPIRAGLSAVRGLIAESAEHLRPEGHFYFVGRTKQGVVRIAQKTAEVFGDVQEVGRGGGFRVYLARRPGNSEISKGDPCGSSR